jgi:hypothetical protein
VFYGFNSEKNQYAPNQTAKITRAITQDGVRPRVSAMIGFLPDSTVGRFGSDVYRMVTIFTQKFIASS